MEDLLFELRLLFRAFFFLPWFTKLEVQISLGRLAVGFSTAEMGPETVCALGWSGLEASRAVKALLCGAETPPDAEPWPP